MKKTKRLIDADDLWQKTFVCEEPGDFRKAIENAPTVDAVEVVRCKDCYYFNATFSCCDNFNGLNRPKPDDYCPYGER